MDAAADDDGNGAGLRWPPTSDDLDAVEVVELAVEPKSAAPSRPTPLPATLPPGRSAGMSLDGGAPGGAAPPIVLPDIVDLEDTDEDAFATEGAVEPFRQTQAIPAASRARPYAWAAAAAALVAAGLYLSPLEFMDVGAIRSLTATMPASDAATSPAAAPTLTSSDALEASVSSRVVAAQSPEAADIADGLSAPPAATLTPAAGGSVEPATAATQTAERAELATSASVDALPTDGEPAVVPTSSAADARPESSSPVEREAPSVAMDTTRADIDPSPPSPRRPASSPSGGAVLPQVTAPIVPPAAPALASATPAPIVRPDTPVVSEDVRIQGVLRRYEAAYAQLDAQAAQAVWPGVDVRALSRAFDNLESQSVRLGNCEFDVRGTLADAECLGSTTYVPRIGSRAPRTEIRAWTFRLQKAGEQWQIVAAEIR